MKRPRIHHFFPKKTTVHDIHRVIKNNPELYLFIVNLDAYIDYLEDKFKENGIDKR